MADNITNGLINENFILNVHKQKPDEFKPKISNIAEKANFLTRGNDNGLVNADGNNSSVAVRDQTINLTAGPNASIKTNGSSNQNLKTSFEEKIITNRFNLATDEVIVNGHKLNPALWEYTDYKEFEDAWGGKHKVGDFCLLGTVLTPTWDHQLKKYMLIRRLARMPMFSPLVNVPEISKDLKVEDPSKKVPDYPVKEESVDAASWYKMVEAEIKKKKADEDKKKKEEEDKKKAAEKKDGDKKSDTDQKPADTSSDTKPSNSTETSAPQTTQTQQPTDTPATTSQTDGKSDQQIAQEAAMAVIKNHRQTPQEIVADLVGAIKVGGVGIFEENKDGK